MPKSRAAMGIPFPFTVVVSREEEKSCFECLLLLRLVQTERKRVAGVFDFPERRNRMSMG